MIDYDEIIKTICMSLQGLPKKIADLRSSHSERRIGDGVWTKMELAELYEIAKSVGCSACPTFDEAWRDGEWLYDMVWYLDAKNFKEDKMLGIYRALENVVLVLESEWSKSPWEVQYDFEKLLVAKSSIKVLVVNDIGESVAKQIVEQGLANYKGCIAGEQYLLAMYSEKTGGFAFWRTNLGQKVLAEVRLDAHA